MVEGIKVLGLGKMYEFFAGKRMGGNVDNNEGATSTNNIPPHLTNVC